MSAFRSLGHYVKGIIPILKATTAKERAFCLTGYAVFMGLYLAEQSYLGMPLSQILRNLPMIAALGAVGAFSILTTYKSSQNVRSMLAGEEPLIEFDPDDIAEIIAELRKEPRVELTATAPLLGQQYTLGQRETEKEKNNKGAEKARRRPKQ